MCCIRPLITLILISLLIFAGGCGSGGGGGGAKPPKKPTGVNEPTKGPGGGEMK